MPVGLSIPPLPPLCRGSHHTLRKPLSSTLAQAAGCASTPQCSLPLPHRGRPLSSTLAQAADPDLPASVPFHCHCTEDSCRAPSRLRPLSCACNPAQSSHVLTRGLPHLPWLNPLPSPTLPISSTKHYYEHLAPILPP